uniref:CUB domain-containing protein n=1 Tax=Romanomermis culicivorax TaxID=13658 RepID=A0A915KGD5_ROMCU
MDCADDDYLELRDGHHRHSPLIGRYCGNLAILNIITQSNRLWIEYMSSGKNGAKPSDNSLAETPVPFVGFKAKYE